MQTQNSLPKVESPKGFLKFTEFLAALQIIASPLLIGSLAGAAIYFSSPSPGRLLLASVVVLLGLLVGIIWAVRQWRNSGTVHFLSRVMATPELDNAEPEETSQAEN